MRITKEILLRVARQTTSQRIYDRPDMVAVYLTGSLLKDEPLLGNSTDIDLVFVHPFQPTVRREIVALTPEVHLDIKHNPRSEYEHPRQLRLDPWLGPEMYAPLSLHDGRHFFDFVQAGLRDKYYEPVNAHGRSQRNLQHARQMWADLVQKPNNSPQSMLKYLKSVNHAANAVAVIKDSPLGERRFLAQFPASAAAAGKPSLTADLFALLGADQAEKDSLKACLPAWEKEFMQAGQGESADVRLHPARLTYYRNGFEALLAGERPLEVLWSLLHTWSLAADALVEEERTGWRDACLQLELLVDGSGRNLERLDAFLDEVEGILDNMAVSNGLNEAGGEA
jgi:hypothetical protein